ncbi:AraC family transcriptional regulator [Paenibacillus montanisoli]|uniref:AraC family transcriptional regulator n=1 Tax=Paenibacillus montanisoli TaxID=2081970 RepID=A0A328U4Z1_9BACL|nr:AraC family transcriptional regulator [Paenibacillus montanisoli]RAP77670.1 AraC family transcriptional regulator [Paenibacillus montanisoli]
MPPNQSGWPVINSIGDIILQAGGHTLGPRKIDDFELVYFPEGTDTVYEVEGTAQLLDSPCFLLTQPGVSHRYLFDRERNVRHQFVHFDYDSLRNKDPRFAALLGSHDIVPAKHISLVAALMSQIVVVANHQSHHWRRRLTALLAAALEELAAYADKTPEFAVSSYPVQIANSIAYIEEHLAEPLTIESIARQSGWSHEHFTRMFVAAVGISPKRMLLERRLHRAEELMMKGAGTVKQIAYLAGFGDEHHFSKMYKRIRGMTATEYMERCKEPIFRHADIGADPGRSFVNRHVVVNPDIK